MKNSATSVLFIDTATTKGMPNTKRNVPVTTDRMLEEPCEATSLTHGFEAERRGRPLRLGNHLEVLMQGIDVWNKWREQHPEIQPDLSNVNLTEFSKANLSNTNLSNTNLCKTMLAFTDLSRANLQGADITESILLRANFDGANLDRTCFSFSNLRGASLTNAIHINRAIINGANLSEADLTNCNLSGANFSECNLSKANLSSADLTGANLSRANLVGTNFREATLTECRIYGISAWDIELTGASQNSLIITPKDQPTITVDNLKIAQFIYLLLNNQEIRDVIDTIAKKAVLILGRFTPERKAILDALRDELRRRGYLPILFDFKKPSSRNLTETVSTLAHLSRFIIADLTDPRSIPNELRAIIPILRVPVQPLLNTLEEPYGMFEDFQDYPWVLPTYRYTDLDSLLASLQGKVIDPAEHKAQELTKPS